MKKQVLRRPLLPPIHVKRYRGEAIEIQPIRRDGVNWFRCFGVRGYNPR